MTEAYLRKWHRTMGIILALFILVQAGSGALLSMAELLPAIGSGAKGQPLPWWEEPVADLHKGGGWPAQAYRLLLGLGIMGMATSGTLIFLKIRARTRKS